ncbi:MAG: acetyl-CoA decarbonylase/synthase complex subunit gamma [Candidatus Bathyarchaeota archaeon]
MLKNRTKKRGKREIPSPIDVYKLLPRTNCEKCGEKNCMAFAVRLVNREASMDKCPPLFKEEYEKAYEELWKLLKPPVKEITIGKDESAVRIGGEFVMYRHELAYINPTAIAIDVTDDLPCDELQKRVKEIQDYSYTYLGQELKLDLVAVRSTSNDPAKFRTAVEKIAENTILPLVLCSFNPNVLKAGLSSVSGKRPLIYAATKDNWRDMADLALMYKCPLVVFAPNDLNLLRSMTKTLTEYGVEDIVLDPGTNPNGGLLDTVSNFMTLRWMACREGDELLGFPLLGTPLAVWMDQESEIAKWSEATVASILMTQYANLIIMHTMDGWATLPLLILRQNIYSDPRKPTGVEPGLRVFGEPDENSPVLFTTNFTLTYFTVSSDIQSSDISNNCYLLVVDTEGIGVQSAAARASKAKGGLTADMIVKAIKESGVEEKVKHRTLIIPGMVANLGSEIERLSGWKVLVGPSSSTEIPKFIEEHWYNKKKS